MLHLVLLRGPVLATYSQTVKHNLLTGRLVYNDETNQITQVEGRIKLVTIDPAEIKAFLVTHEPNGFLKKVPKNAAKAITGASVAELEALLAQAKAVDAATAKAQAETEAHATKEATELAAAQQKLADAADAKIAATEVVTVTAAQIMAPAAESRAERKFREKQARKAALMLEAGKTLV